VADSAEPFLQVTDLHAGYGGLDILQGVDIEVRPGEVVCIVGPNGSGKSTLFKGIYGLAQVTSGRVTFKGQDITGLAPEAVLRSRIAIVPQLATVFPGMTVQENLEMGMYTVRDKGRIRKRIEEMLDLFPHLRELRSRPAGVLSGGERRALEIIRALMLEPELVLMDEPSAGLSPALTADVFARIRELNSATGLAFLLIEQNARQGLEASHRAYVMEMGRVRHTGPSAQLLEDETVRKAFFPAAL
jgi:ABC-type branched-subunit amino acid transport system ATPase component